MILYSLSYDNDVMSREALSQRQRNDPHTEGMLNVAFTRARDEVHVFHSAPIEEFFKRDGGGAIGDWLDHVRKVQERPRQPLAGNRLGRLDSEFEGDVADALLARGVSVIHQYPACGYRIDLVCALGDRRVAVECDGPTHFDEHGRRRVEDLERLAILRRADWTLVNIPYRKWLKAPGEQIARVMEALESDEPSDDDEGSNLLGSVEQGGSGKPVRVRPEQHALFQALREGLVNEEQVLRRARDLIGRRRLTPGLRQELQAGVVEMNHLGLLIVEEGEYFLTPQGRVTKTEPMAVTPPAAPALSTSGRKKSSARTAGRPRSRSGHRATASLSKGCHCGGAWVLRSGRYGKFYGCSRYPSCRRTRSYL